MKKIIIYISTLVLFIQSCQNKDKSQLKNNPIVKADSSKAKEVDPNISNKEQIELVKNFMKWYINNSNVLNNFDTIGGGPMDAQENEEAKNYYVDFSKVEKYIEELKKSGFLADVFLKNEKQIFIEGDKYFKKNPENDSPPFGFDYDRFFFTQESLEDVLPNIEKSKYLVNQKNDSISEVRFYLPMTGVNYKYTLKKINARWVIEKIDSEQRP
ncbi:hypothetical protein [Flavobacterium chilense]|uniref:DUF3828 domain-containing protein n=1 Tax=Flavobacterium chilense TaxID=946677 RepID=A0A1M7CJ41_9FLAO|nr:hypothetical protein [Flavobacterium chilense]SHL67177.1 hypothetical protein SAMN05444484_102174 [Flavobacterium chilense]